MAISSRTMLALCSTSVALLTACRTSAPPPAQAIDVPVVAAAPATLAHDLTLSAEFRPYNDVDVMAKVAGYVKTIRVDIGDHVRTGDVIATLDVPEIQDDMGKAKAGLAAAEANVVTARSAIQRAEAQAKIAHLSYQRIMDVSTRDAGLVPKQEIDVAQSRDLEAAAQLASANSALQASEQSKAEADSEYARTQAMLQYATIRAPFDGVITKRYASVGSMIQAGISSQSQAMPVVRLAQNNLLRLTLPVPVSDVSSVQDGQSVDVNVTSLGITFAGKVTRYADAVQTATRTMDTEVDVPNRDGKLVPGMYAEVHLHLAALSDALSVPLDAVDGIGTGTQQVYLVRDGELHLTKVTIGLQTSSRVEILSGLQSGDQVVVGRHSGLSDGEKVTPHRAAYESAEMHS